MASGLGVNTLVLAAGAFVGGLVIGGFGPRAELRALEAERFELQRECAREGSVSRDLAGLITRGIDEASSASDDPVAEDPEEGVRQVGEPGADEVDPTPSGEEEPADAKTGGGSDSLESAREMLAARSAQARAALFEDAEPSEEQAAAIDAVIDELNDGLRELAFDLVTHTRENGEPDRRTMMAMGADTLDLLVSSEDRMLEVLTPEQREALRDEVTDPTAFVDPSVIDALAELEALERP